MKTILKTILIASAALGLSNCGTPPSNAKHDAGVGALGGAVLGGIIGHQSGNTAEGALIGGVLGGGAGYAVGNEKDKANQR